MPSSPKVLEDVQYVVQDKRQVTPVIVEVSLGPVGARIDFLAGQYVLLGDLEYRLTPRSYSIACAPRTDGSLRLLVSWVAKGELSGWMHRDLRVGDRVLVSGPYGAFLDQNAGSRDEPVLYLAGGSGIAPVHALAEAALCRGSRRPATLFFSARTPADLIDRDGYAGWAARYPNFRYLRTLTRASGELPIGRIPAILGEWFPDLQRHEIYIAGPPGFVSGCASAARRLGARPGRTHTEAFYLEPTPWKSED